MLLLLQVYEQIQKRVDSPEFLEKLVRSSNAKAESSKSATVTTKGTGHSTLEASQRMAHVGTRIPFSCPDNYLGRHDVSNRVLMVGLRFDLFVRIEIVG